MNTALRDLPSFTLDPARDERVPDDAASLTLRDLTALRVDRLARLRSLRVLRVYGAVADVGAFAALTEALPTLERGLRRARGGERRVGRGAPGGRPARGGSPPGAGRRRPPRGGGLSRGGGHALICTRVDRGAAPSVGVTSRHRVDALFEG